MIHRRPNGLLVLYVWPYLSLRVVGRFSGEPGLANLAFFTVTVTLLLLLLIFNSFAWSTNWIQNSPLLYLRWWYI